MANGQSGSVRSFTKNAHGVLFTMRQGTLTIEICSDTIIHVVYTLRTEPPAPAVAVVKETWAPVPFTVKQDRDKISVSTRKLTVAVQRRSGRVSFLDRRGSVILQEPDGGGKTLTQAIVTGQNTWRPEQIFLSRPDEAYYGLGQHQEGFFNWRGIPLRLQQVDANIAMPVVISNKGYGIIWNNASITDFNPTNQIVKIDPTSKCGKFTSGAAGLYGFMATGGTGRDRIGLQINGQTIVDLEGYVAPYAGSGVLELKPNTEYSLTVQGASNDAAVYVRPPSNLTGFRSEAGDAIDYYFLYGPHLNQVVAEYREATGAAPLFPKWAYGFWQCRERYSNQNQLLEAAAGFRQRNIPVDVIVQDWQYWGKYGWNAMRFDENNYPDPSAMTKKLHDENLHFVISVWSKFESKTDIFQKMQAHTLLVPGTEWFDAFNPKAREMFWSSMRDGIFRHGADGWWLDATEPEFDILKDKPTFLGAGNFVRNAYPLYVTQAVYQGQRTASPDQRVVILTRSAYLGQQRNAAATWSGDVESNWSVFRKQIAAGLGLTMAGIPYWTTDVGGFIRPPDQYQSAAYRELLTRWFEYGVFCPLFRIHGNESETEIWKYGSDVETTFRKYDELRYRMLPYIYSVAWRITNQGDNLMRALPLEYRTDPKVTNIADEFLFGPSLLVSPIISPDAKSRSVYLPREGAWIDFWTGQRETGGQTVTSEAPLDRIPVYVKAGSIVPLGPVMQFATERKDPIELRIYTGSDTTFVLYDDEGDNYNYERGLHATIPMRWSEASRTLTIGARAGQFPGMPRRIMFRVACVRPGRGVGFDPVIDADAEIAYEGREIRIRLDRLKMK
jgi:alpha-D-xyloside xylohydrolase